MNKNQTVKTIKIDNNLTNTLEKFQKTLKNTQKIVEVNVAGDYLVVIVESTKGGNLLLG